MKIAVASTGTQVAGHFGHCESFRIFTVENGGIAAESNVPNPGHKPGFLPNFLGDLGVTVVIAGGIGGGAVEIFKERNIDVISGAEGEARAAAEAFLAGKLKSTGAVCQEHQHHHDHEHESGCGH
jgi:predicted Fe-Mo cluster-binding NifX family protein